MSEAELQRQIVKDLTFALGAGTRGFVIEQNAVRSRRVKRGPEPGTPDLQVVLRGGVTAWLEVKLPGEELSESQVHWHVAAIRLGHRVHVVRSTSEALRAVEET
jgi:hypothetical protein